MRLKNGVPIKTCYEWRIEIHPNNQEDIEDILFANTIDEINSFLSRTNDPVDVCLVKMECECDNNGNPCSNDNLIYFYLDFNNKEFIGSKPPIKFQKQAKHIDKPKFIYVAE